MAGSATRVVGLPEPQCADSIRGSRGKATGCGSCWRTGVAWRGATPRCSRPAGQSGAFPVTDRTVSVAAGRDQARRE
ncbi:hypothetical protein MATL_G00076150 [Megalops atlanticus]|uniref:Uncharacterized protein n=1 Tax=Megalops atlanticus TaxID=7932 RepID=A0A9D3QAQ6_MEGAT|nr:hypothetical protein MATL_G00076150 [Megalops atlanticus]